MAYHGPENRPTLPGLDAAVRALSLPKRKPTEADARPASSVLPTPAQREALRLSGKEV